MDGRTPDRVAKAKALSLLGSMALVALVIEAWPTRTVPAVPTPLPRPMALPIAPADELVIPGNVSALSVPPADAAPPAERRRPFVPASHRAPEQPLPLVVETNPAADAPPEGPLPLLPPRLTLPELAPESEESDLMVRAGEARTDSPDRPANALARGVTATGDAIKTAFKITGKSIVGALARAF